MAGEGSEPLISAKKAGMAVRATRLVTFGGPANRGACPGGRAGLTGCDRRKLEAHWVIMQTRLTTEPSDIDGMLSTAIFFAMAKKVRDK